MFLYRRTRAPRQAASGLILRLSGGEVRTFFCANLFTGEMRDFDWRAHAPRCNVSAHALSAGEFKSIHFVR